MLNFYQSTKKKKKISTQTLKQNTLMVHLICMKFQFRPSSSNYFKFNPIVYVPLSISFLSLMASMKQTELKGKIVKSTHRETTL